MTTETIEGVCINFFSMAFTLTSSMYWYIIKYIKKKGLYMKRTISIFLLILLLLFAFSGCYKSGNMPEDTTEDTATPEDTTAPVKTESPAEDFYYTEKDDGTLKISYRGTDADVVVPSEIDGKIVTEIMDGISGTVFHYAKDVLCSVVIPDTIVKIGDIAFKECTKLAEINLPDSLIYIGTEAFYGCTSLKQITIPADCFNKYGDKLHSVFASSGLETVIFKEGLEIIPYGAFAITNIKEIVLPSSVKKISSYAFRNCNNLESVILNDGLISVENYAFGQTNIKEIIIPKSVKEINEWAFYKCEALQKVIYEGDAPEKFVEEHSYKPYGTNFTVYYNNDAKGFTTPIWNGYKTKIIGSDVEGYKTLNSIEYTENSDGGITIIGYTGANTTLEIPAQIEGKNVAEIESSAFSFNTDIVSVVLPDTIKTVGSRAFQDCTSLQSIVLSKNLEIIDAFAFFYCKSLQTITLPSSLVKLGESAFSYCTSLKSINIPKSITDWGIGVFGYSSIETVDFEEGLEIIGKYAFCINNIKTLVLPKSLKTISNSAFAGCYKIESITLNEGLQTIGELAFSGSNIKTIVFPQSLKTISERAFAHCSKIESVTLNEGLQTIGEEAFGSAKITEIIIPKTVEYIGENAFPKETILK